MSPKFDVAAAAALTRGNITYFPVVPGRLEFAVEVRHYLQQQRPDVLAIELPSPLRSSYLRAISRFPELSIIRYPDPLDPVQWVYVPVEPTDPFVEALRTAYELGIRVEFIEPNWGDRPHLGDAYPDSYAIQMIGRDRYIESYRLEKHEPTEESLDYAAAMARKLQGMPVDCQVVAVVALNLLDLILDAMETPQERAVEPRGSAYLAELCNAEPVCLAEITVEFPFLIERYERYRLTGDSRLVDRMATQIAALETAEVGLWKASGARPFLETWQYRQIAKFARNLAHSSGELVADIVDLTLAARGVAGDNYAAHLWDALNLYPAQQAECALPTIAVSSEQIWCRRRRIKLRTRPAALRRPGKRPITESTLVLIFDEDRDDSKYPFKTTQDDSAVYSNAHSEHGGLLVTQSGAAMDDIWSDSRYDAALTKAERLLLAALHHSPDRRVVHIAAKPPRRLMREIAEHLGRQIQHVPIGQVSRAKLEGMRNAVMSQLQ